MKKKLKKIKWKKIEDMIVNWLNNKVEVSAVIIIIIGEFLLFNICLFTNKKEYSYIDMNDNNGKSSNCYYDRETRDLRCMIPVRVQQYFEGR